MMFRGNITISPRRATMQNQQRNLTSPLKAPPKVMVSPQSDVYSDDSSIEHEELNREILEQALSDDDSLFAPLLEDEKEWWLPIQPILNNNQHYGAKSVLNLDHSLATVANVAPSPVLAPQSPSELVAMKTAKRQVEMDGSARRISRSAKAKAVSRIRAICTNRPQSHCSSERLVAGAAFRGGQRAKHQAAPSPVIAPQIINPYVPMKSAKRHFEITESSTRTSSRNKKAKAKGKKATTKKAACAKKDEPTYEWALARLDLKEEDYYLSQAVFAPYPLHESDDDKSTQSSTDSEDGNSYYWGNIEEIIEHHTIAGDGARGYVIKFFDGDVSPFPLTLKDLMPYETAIKLTANDWFDWNETPCPANVYERDKKLALKGVVRPENVHEPTDNEGQEAKRPSAPNQDEAPPTAIFESSPEEALQAELRDMLVTAALDSPGFRHSLLEKLKKSHRFLECLAQLHPGIDLDAMSSDDLSYYLQGEPADV